LEHLEHVELEEQEHLRSSFFSSTQIDGICIQVEELHLAAMESTGIKVKTMISWTPPFMDWVKLNLNGSMRTSAVVVLCPYAGGVTRDATASWL